MIFPWMFDEMHALKPFKEAAHLLAEKEDWPPLYDIAALNNNKVNLLHRFKPHVLGFNLHEIHLCELFFS